MPSDDVVNVIKICENVFRLYVCGDDHKNPKITSDSGIKVRMIYVTNKKASERKLFSKLDKHDVDHEAVSEDLHSTQLIKMISNKYFTIRLLRYGQQYTERVIQKSNIGLRQQSNKLVLFKGI